MDESRFDALTRRASLAGLGAAALLTAVPSAAKAGKAGKKARKKCRRQVAPCAARFKEVCPPANQDCLDNTDVCCGFLGRCNAAAASECLIQNFIL